MFGFPELDVTSDVSRKPLRPHQVFMGNIVVSFPGLFGDLMRRIYVTAGN